MGKKNFRESEALGEEKAHQPKWLIELDFSSSAGETLEELLPANMIL